MRSLLRACCISLILGPALSAVAQTTYVVMSSGAKRACSDIDADANGDLQVSTGGTTKLTIKRGQYQYVVTPKPDSVTALERAFAANDHKRVAANAPGMFEKYKYLGWGGYIAAIQASSKLATGDTAGALRVVQGADSTTVAGLHSDAVNKAKISALIALDRGDEAAPALEKLKASKDSDLAAFAFLADGRLLEKQGRADEAILAYLKTVLLFKDGVADTEKQQARQRVAALLEAKGDPRANMFK
ncbi:MAG: hypothetical protein RRC34_15690 [Lentisphaeria bacterium]|nr:hypothetical protein [Lentisphaeria bacterium]